MAYILSGQCKAFLFHITKDKKLKSNETSSESLENLRCSRFVNKRDNLFAFWEFRMIFISINTLQEIKPVLFDSSVREKRIEFSPEMFRVETMTNGFRIQYLKKAKALLSITVII